LDVGVLDRNKTVASDALLQLGRRGRRFFFSVPPPFFFPGCVKKKRALPRPVREI
jgi:hypothetical protein